MTKTHFSGGDKLNELPVDPFPAPEKQPESGCWIYGRAERERFLHRRMIREKDDAHLKVGYPGEFMPLHGTMHFRAELPAGVFPVACVGTPALTEIRMASPGRFEFTLSVPDTELDVPCFRCDADVVWEASPDGIEWHDASRTLGGDVPPHRAELTSFWITPVRLPDGMYDLGREIFGRVWIRHAPEAKLFVGESIPEAENRRSDGFEQRLDLIRKDEETLCSAVPLAFRYLSLEHADGAEVEVEALYTPLTMRKRFSCGDKELDAIWERSAYTLHLCTQHFLIDGVKRDRLPWAGDLAVSLLGMSESFCEPGPIRDTLAVLGSAGIRNTHINGITDYTLWYLINFELYERFFDEPEFLRQEYFRIVETAELLLAQRLENGLLPVRGWVLIDWAEGDKNCALQILFFMALRSLSLLAERMDDREHAATWSRTAAELRETIRRDFYDPASGLFRCSPGGNEFLRHQNFLAVGSVATPEESRRIAGHLLKDELPPVGTPYMKSFEILALIRSGFRDEAIDEIRRFWGGMIKDGATTFFEACGGGKSGSGLYDFYDRPFGLSLCHAWSSAPLFLLPMIFRDRQDLGPA
ncbi:MAG: hypothetical protein IKO93_02215 [Lentisphaeria bacterium]|nr:hypothetical protein [Lentisphaeria bacterium]